jgi:hypothetical protein
VSSLSDQEARSAAYTEREKELRRLIRGHFPLRNEFFSVRLVLRELIRMARSEASRV